VGIGRKRSRRKGCPGFASLERGGQGGCCWCCHPHPSRMVWTAWLAFTLLGDKRGESVVFACLLVVCVDGRSGMYAA